MNRSRTEDAQRPAIELVEEGYDAILRERDALVLQVRQLNLVITEFMERPLFSAFHVGDFGQCPACHLETMHAEHLAAVAAQDADSVR